MSFRRGKIPPPSDILQLNINQLPPGNVGAGGGSGIPSPSANIGALKDKRKRTESTVIKIFLSILILPPCLFSTYRNKHVVCREKYMNYKFCNNPYLRIFI